MIHSFKQWEESQSIGINESINNAKKRFLDKKRITEEEFEDALEFDKSSNGKYIEKIIEFYLRGEDKTETELQRIGKVFVEFHNLLERNKIKKSDITSYRTLEDLKSAVKEAKKEEIERETKELTNGNFDIIVNNDDMLIVIPLDHEASKLWGDDTKWCTTSTNPSFWYSYTLERDISFYYIWIKNVDLILNSNEYLEEDDIEVKQRTKMAVAVSNYYRDQYECFDKDDNSIDFKIVKKITGLDEDTFESVEMEKPMWYYDVTNLELDISKVEVNKDGSINYDGDVYIYYPSEQYTWFKKVWGDWISANERNNDVNSMKECSLPEEIQYDFSFNNTDIEDLQGCPQIIGRDCDLSDNPKLKSIEGAPKEIGGDFNYKGTELSLSKNSKIRMTADDIRKYVKVGGKIINDSGEWEEGESDKKAFYHPDQLTLFNESKKSGNKLNR
jgi:hypothetical protein